MTRKDLLSGQRIDPKPITGRETIPELVDHAFLAYNAGRLAEILVIRYQSQKCCGDSGQSKHSKRRQ